MTGTNPTPILMIAGPTAVGKTALSIRLAETLDAEIVSADSRQIYREMTIGTAKPSSEELARVRHHFINELSLAQPYSAGRYQRDAYARIAEIRSRNRASLVVGGSTLYLQALKHGLADIPDIPRHVRETVRERLRTEGPEALFAELQAADPVSSGRMDSTKTQRLLRALEVYHATGRPLSHYHSEQTPPPYRFHTVVLNLDRAKLYARINRRVDGMLEAGLLEEVESILAQGFDPSKNPLRTIGYQEPVAYLRGEISYQEMVELIKQNTRRYAKRQLTWFRGDPSNTWIEADQPEDAVLSEILGCV